MGKEEIKAFIEILDNKRKFKRIMIILGVILFTVAVVTIAGFYFGAITYNG